MSEVVQRSLLDSFASLERDRSVLYARRMTLLAQMDDAWDDDPGGLVLEVSGTARMGQRTASGSVARATQLVSRMPTALGLLAAGEMRVATVEILLMLTRNATHPVQQVIDARLSTRLASLDAADARRLIMRTLPEVEAELDPAAQSERLEAAHRDRGVWIKPEQDGMSRIGADLPVLDAHRWSLDFTELVRAQKVLDDQAGIVRTQAQRQADVFGSLPSRLLQLAEAAREGTLIQLLEQARQLGAPDPGQSPAGTETPCPPNKQWLIDLLRLPVRRPAMLNLHLAMTTAMELDQRCGWVDGYGAVPASIARLLLPSASWRRIAVDERTGIPVGVDPAVSRPITPWDYEYDHNPHSRHAQPGAPPAERAEQAELAARIRLALRKLLIPMGVRDAAEPQHDPSRALREFARLRDQACDGPGCARSARACDLDHEHPWDHGGPTAAWNLKHRSPRCHHAKHDGWTVNYDPDTGISTWTSPIGSSYQRLSPWTAPTVFGADVQLPSARLTPPLGSQAERNLDQPEIPLWSEPIVKKPSPPKPPHRPDGGWHDDGPPPF